ncbi:MAG: hypothetical protein IJC71_00915 [Clostridia bacterium]|nr:hypothetical protein [Clostridia bacterium]
MWYTKEGKDNNIVLSSRVRLARNLSGYAFPGKLDDAKSAELIEKIRTVFEGKEGWSFTDCTALKTPEKAALLEKHIISREFAEKKSPAALLANEEKSVYIMLMEEDHLRLQCITPGLDLTTALEAVFEAEAWIDEAFEIAYTENLGYLTHCPTNLGTGLRASAMLHLPAYTKAGGIRNLTLQLSKLGMTIRGMNGEGSAPSANLYQISNEVTLGITEEETVAKLNEVVGKIAAKEWELREKMDANQKEDAADRAMRTIGMMLYANKLNAGELVSMYSDLRLAASMKMITIPVQLLDEMFFTSMPNTLIAENEEARAAAVRDKLRAEKIRLLLAKAGFSRN